MTENEKLRALLVEARDGYVGHNLDCATVVCEECSFAARIDAALAEPVGECGLCAASKAFHDVAVSQRDGNAYLLDLVTHEIDEARAKVDQLKDVIRLILEADALREHAFERGDDDASIYELCKSMLE